MTADGGHLHLAVNMCWPYAYLYTKLAEVEKEVKKEINAANDANGMAMAA